MKRLLPILTVVFLFLSASCAQLAPSGTIKIGLLPIIESLPFWVADRDGYFGDQNLKVELVLFVSAVERDAALQAKAIDGELNDLISAALLNKDQETIKITRKTYQATPRLPMISIVVPATSKIASVNDLRGAKVGISRNSVIEYVLDEILAANGLKPTDIEKVEVSKIPLRVEMLMNGQLAAAVLPEPFTALAQKQGAKVLAHDGADGIGESVLSFRREVLRDKAQFVDRFLVAYEQAVNDINSKPEDYRALLVEKGKIPDLIAKTFPVPEIPTASVPSQSSIQRSMNWMMRAGLLSRSLSYDQMVDGTHLPRR